MDWINTYSGKKFTLLEPDIKQFCLKDQAHALACINRYNGHLPIPLSVGAHTILVAEEVERRLEDKGAPVDKILAGKRLAAIHDNHEAYIGDICRPLKHTPLFRFFRELEGKYHDLIRQWVGLAHVPQDVENLVETVDHEICNYETTMFNLHKDWEGPPVQISKKQRAQLEAKCVRYMHKSFDMVKYEYVQLFVALFPDHPDSKGALAACFK